jgi:multimeric flavodoxin WrbA
MSKILILNGSPRKNGNTYNLAEAFKKGAEKNNDVEIISVCDYNINPCKGCNYCFKSEGNDCVQDDDMALIYDKMKEADFLIIASPVYFYGISAQLKKVVDRFHTPMRNSFNTKKLGLILVGAAKIPELFDSIITQYELVLKFFKLDDIGRVLVSGVRETSDLSENDLTRAYELGAKL